MIPGRVTIGIPTRNRAEFAYRAVRSALAQTNSDIEVIVSDNASTDDTLSRLDAVASPSLSVLRQTENAGMVANFNACLEAANGEFFLLLSDDDVLDPRAIELLSLPLLDPAGAIGISWSPCKILNSEGQTLWTSGGGPGLEPSLSMVSKSLAGQRGPRLCSVLLRTADARAVGGYEERHGALCDIGNWMRVALQYDFAACHEQPLASYTMHHGSETSGGACRQWRHWAETVSADLLEAARGRAEQSSVRELQAAGKRLVACSIATVLMSNKGNPGWLRYALRESIEAREYMCTPFVAGRLLRDGLRLLRLGA